MFERFTDRARQVVVHAQEQARAFGHSYIGTEHLLLGLIDEGEGVACKALTSLGIELEPVRRRVEEIIGRGDHEPSGEIPFTPRAKKVLELSLREAISLGHNYIGTEHILLGLIREEDGVAAQVLKQLGADLGGVRKQVVQLVSGTPLWPAQVTRQEGEARPRRGFLRSAFRVEHEMEDPATWPRCPRCRSPLEETARYRVLDVPAHEEGEVRAVPFAFCSKCGGWLGTIG